MKKRYTEEQIIGFLREADAGVPIVELCRRHGFSEASFYLWRALVRFWMPIKTRHSAITARFGGLCCLWVGQPTSFQKTFCFFVSLCPSPHPTLFEQTDRNIKFHNLTRAC